MILLELHLDQNMSFSYFHFVSGQDHDMNLHCHENVKSHKFYLCWAPSLLHETFF